VSEGYAQKDYEVLARALREARPADVMNNAEARETWERCVDCVELALRDNDPDLDWRAFRAACGTGIGIRDRKYAIRFFLLVAALIGVPILWTYHHDAVMEARAAGRGDVWAGLCEQHPGLAERLLPSDENGAPYTCKHFEHHFDDN